MCLTPRPVTGATEPVRGRVAHTRRASLPPLSGLLTVNSVGEVTAHREGTLCIPLPGPALLTHHCGPGARYECSVLPLKRPRCHLPAAGRKRTPGATCPSPTSALKPQLGLTPWKVRPDPWRGPRASSPAPRCCPLRRPRQTAKPRKTSQVGLRASCPQPPSAPPSICPSTVLPCVPPAPHLHLPPVMLGPLWAGSGICLCGRGPAPGHPSPAGQ